MKISVISSSGSAPRTHRGRRRSKTDIAYRLRGMAQPGSASALGAEGRRFKSYYPDHGEVSERLKEPVLKTGVGRPTVGSNPTLSATLKYSEVFFV